MPPRVAIIGAGWAGLAAAARAVERGCRVSLHEAARRPGGRARAVPLALPGGGAWAGDNGQHILIGAYTATLGLMRKVGVDPARALRRLPLALRYSDGSGLALPRLPRPLNAAAGILGARGWPLADRWALLGAASRWRRAGFACDPSLTVAALGAALSERARRDFIEPLCVAALNTRADEASAAVFLRVLRDALLGPPDSPDSPVRGSADLLLPQTDLSALLPDPALRWLQERGAAIHLGQRVNALQWRAPHWLVGGQPFDHAVLALSAPAAAQVLAASAALAAPPLAGSLAAWGARAAALRHNAISTVYALAEGGPSPAPMLALRCGEDAPAQFVFDRGPLAGGPAPARLLAFVISDAQDGNAALAQAVQRQAQAQLGLAARPLRVITEKRAAFACTPALRRPPMTIAPGLLACGDYVQGPYPATLEGAVRSGLRAGEAL